MTESQPTEPQCRQKRKARGLPYPKSGCWKCGSLLQEGWRCAEESQDTWRCPMHDPVWLARNIGGLIPRTGGFDCEEVGKKIAAALLSYDEQAHALRGVSGT